MKIHLHVERLVLDGLPVSASERPLLQAAMEAELTHLLRIGGLSDGLRNGAALAHVRAGTVRVGKESNPKKLGTDIAGAVHQGLGSATRKQFLPMEHRLPAEHRGALPGGNPR